MTSGRFILLLLCASVSLNIKEGAFALANSVHQGVDDNVLSVLQNMSSQSAEIGQSETKQGQSYLDSDKDATKEAAYRKRAKPFKNIFMGIYKNFKSTYLGNQTSLDYKRILQERLSDKNGTIFTIKKDGNDREEEQQNVLVNAIGREEELRNDIMKISKPKVADFLPITEQTNVNTLHYGQQSHDGTVIKKAKMRRRNRKQNKNSSLHYTIGPGVNMRLDMSKDIVNVKLNADNLKEILEGHWLSDKSEEGRGKKYDMVTKVLPLFVIPFLIQSAIIPFLVTKLKLLLMKSILIGKLAIFLLIISALKNSNKAMQSYEVGPSYWAGEPSRRSEYASLAAYNGYRVEGKPATWIN